MRGCRLLAIVMTILWAAGCNGPATSPGPGDADAAYPFTLSSLAGPPVALADLQGRWVLVNFWATWCAPCREEMADLERLSRQYPQRLVVLGVNMRESPETIRAFLAETRISFAILLEPDDEMLLAYGVRGLPLTALIGPDGRLHRRIVGPVDGATFSFDGEAYPSKR